MTYRKYIISAAIAAALACGTSTAAFADNAPAGTQTDPVKDAWLDGKLETVYLLNRHLNNFTIDTEVVNGTAYLKGSVESDVERQLATALAQGVEGIHDVKNDLQIAGESSRRARDDSHRDFMQVVDDATKTASIKSTLLMNESTHGLAIDVDTKNDVVTLSGDVKSAEEKALAEQLARNVDGVDAVTNKLTISAK